MTFSPKAVTQVVAVAGLMALVAGSVRAQGALDEMQPLDLKGPAATDATSSDTASGRAASSDSGASKSPETTPNSPSQPDATIECVSTRTVDIAIATIRSGAAPIHGYTVWFTSDGGQSWERHSEKYEPAEAVRFTAPRDGRFGFVVVPRDTAGLEGGAPQPGQVPAREIIIDTTRPTLEVLSPGREDFIYAGEPIRLEWNAWDAQLDEAPVRIEWRRNADEPWQSIDDNELRPASGKERWWSPLVDGSVEIRYQVTDRAGNRVEWSTPTAIRIVPFDGFRGARTIATDPYSSYRKFPIHYRVVDLTPIELATVELWWRKDLGPWQRAVDPNRVSPFVFEAPTDGSYYFCLRAIDHNHHATCDEPGSDTPPDARVVVDTHSPDVTLQVGAGGTQLAHTAGEPIALTFQVRDVNLAPHACDIEVSIDGGVRWQSLKTALDVRGEIGEFIWTPPLIRSEAMRFRMEVRDLAGNVTTQNAPTVVQLVDPMLDPIETSRQLHARAVALARLHDPTDLGSRRSLERALESIDLALLYDTEFADAHHDRGQILSLLGNRAGALEALERASESEPANIPFRFDRVRALLNASDHASGKAKDAYVNEARRQLELVSREQIYNYPRDQYRDLLRRYRILAEDIESRVFAE